MSGPNAHSFIAYGAPAAQGSKSLVRGRNGVPRMIEASRRVMPWRAVVAASALAAGVTVFRDDVAVDIVAVWVRPTSHFGRNGVLKKSAPPRPRYADADKICRAILDALAGIAYANDRQVSRLAIDRTWGTFSGAFITISPVGEDGHWVYGKLGADAPRKEQNENE